MRQRSVGIKNEEDKAKNIHLPKGKEYIGKVNCPVCRKDFDAKSVKFFPLDLLALRDTLKARTVEVISTCSRCYDDVPSFSWCQNCSTALCEFHHQDHKLSLQTCKHDIMTFKELSSRGISVEPKLPPVTCPEITLSDCSAYCKNCRHLVSSTAIASSHKDHDVKECDSFYPTMLRGLQDTLERGTSKAIELTANMDNVRNVLFQLDENADAAAALVEAEFNSLRNLIDQREKSLIKHIQTVSAKKRAVLTKQLNALGEITDDVRTTVNLADQTLKEASDSSQNENISMYVIAVADAAEARQNELETLVKTLPMKPHENSTITSSFSIGDTDALHSLISMLGSVHTSDLDGELKPTHTHSRTLGQTPSKADLWDESETSGLGMRKDYERESGPGRNDSEDKAQSKTDPGSPEKYARQTPSKIQFTIRSGTREADSPPSSQLLGGPGNGGPAPSVGSNSSSSSSSSSSIHPQQQRQYLVVEIRQAVPRQTPNALFLKEQKEGQERPSASEVLQGPLLGQIVINTEVDKKLIGRHELKSFLESVTMEGLPVIRITKEWQATRE